MSSKNKSYSKYMELPKETILGVDITSASSDSILEYIFNSFKKLVSPYYIVTPNPEIIVLANKNNDFKKVLNNAKLALNDGVGVALAAHIVGKSLQERFTGVELVEKVCEKSNDWPITVGFLGAGPKVAERVAECLKRKYPHLRVSFAQAELSENKKMPLADILFVALGAPKQEMWMAAHVGKIPVKVMAGVGGAFDQIVNPSLRPPKVIAFLGLGWLYRLIRQPWRWRRQLTLGEFLWLLVRQTR